MTQGLVLSALSSIINFFAVGRGLNGVFSATHDQITKIAFHRETENVAADSTHFIHIENLP